MLGWYFFSFDISSKKIWDEPIHHRQLISSVWKLMPHPVKDLFKTPGHLIRSIATQNKWKSSYFQQNWLLYTLVLVNSPMCTGSKNQVPNRLKIQFVELDFYKLIYQKFGFISLENMVRFDGENKSKKKPSEKNNILGCSLYKQILCFP